MKIESAMLKSVLTVIDLSSPKGLGEDAERRMYNSNYVLVLKISKRECTRVC